MTAQLPPSSYSFPAAFSNSSSFPHDASASATTNFEQSATHDNSNNPLNHSDTTPFSSTATPSSSYFSHSFTSPPLSGSEDIPKIGSIRCYWTILSPSLDYVYLDPLLEHHLGDQARQFLGSNLLDFVHPDERDQLAEDLLPKPDRIAGVETAGVFGSVTRLRYSRLVGILRKLGCPDVPTLPDADKYALDEDYLNLDLTTSWIAGNGITRGTGSDGGSGGGQGNLGNGAVLAFFHVVGDKDHIKNNDQFERGDWTNWCGVQVDEHRYFTPTRCQALVDVLERITSSTSRPSTALSAEEDSKSALLASLHGLSSDSTDGPPPHVFQILDRNGKTIVSFPTPQDDDGRKRYEVESYAALAREVVARPRGAANAKTSCTKRYRSKHPVMKDSILTTIESVVIMYGSITFACFQTGGIYLTSAKKTALGLNQASITPTPVANDFNLEDVPSTAPNLKNYLGYNNNKRASPFIQGPPSLGSPPIKRIKKEANASPRRSNSAPDDGNDSKNLSISTAFGRGPYRPSLEPEYGQNGGVSPTVASASAILGSISTSNQNDGPSSTTDTNPQEHHHQFNPSNFPHFRPHGASPASLYPPAYPVYSQSQSTSPYQAPPTQGNGYFPPNYTQPNDQTHQQPQTQSQIHNQNSFSSIHRDPLPVRSMNNNVQSDNAGPIGGSSNGNPNADPSGTKESKKSRTKPDGPVSKPGPGKACESCGTIDSPEWRKGPSGAKSLCNACGLRHARTVARQKKLAEQAANGIPPKVKKKRGKKAAKEAAEQSAASASNSTSAPSTSVPLNNTLPATSSAHTTYEPAFSRSDAISNYKAYTPYYTSAPPHSSSYAVVAAHPPSSSGPPQTSSAVSAYPISSSGYYPATTTYPFSTYPPTSAPILTHIPIHHTLAATLAPLSAPVSIHSHDYPRNEPVPTSYPHSSFSSASSSETVHAYSQPSDNAGLYHQHLQQQHQPTSSSSAPIWQPTYTSSEIHHSSSSAPASQPSLAPSSYSSAPPHHSMNSHSTSPHLHHPQPTSYQPYQGWSQDHTSQQ